MTKAVLFASWPGDIRADMAFVNNLAATTAPGVGDDINDGYVPGSAWVIGATNTIYVCTDNTAGAAVWVVTSSSETTPGQVHAPAATTPTGTGGAASLTGGAGGTTSGAGGTSSTRGGAATASNSAGGAADTTGGAGSGSAAGGIGKVVGGAGGATGAGGKAQLIGGAGGATSGNGAPAEVTGGAGTAGNGNGGSVVLTGGAKNGSGIAGGVRVESILIVPQGAPAAKTTSATLTAAELLSGIITVTQGAGAASAQQLPTGTAIQAALPADFAAGDAFDFSVINLGGASEVASITVNTDVTIVGNAAIPIPATGAQSSGRFRCRKTADHVFVVYRMA